MNPMKNSKEILVVLKSIDKRLTNLEAGQKDLEAGQKGMLGRLDNLETSNKNILKRLDKIENKLEATFEQTGKNFEAIVSLEKQVKTILVSA